MSLGANRVEGLRVNLTVDDLWAARGVSGEARLARAEVAGQSIADVRLTATGDADVSDVDFSGVVRRAGGESARPAHRRPADPARPCKLHRRGSWPAARARGSGDPDLWKRWPRHPEFRARRRWRAPVALRPRRLDAGPSSVCDANAARGARLRFGRRRPVRRRRRRGDPPRNAGRPVWRLAPAPDPGERATDAKRLHAAAGRRGFRAAQRRPHVARRRGRRGRGQFRPLDRLGAALGRWRARRRHRRQARRRPRQRHAVGLRAARVRLARRRDATARHDRQAAGARVDPAHERRVPR